MTQAMNGVITGRILAAVASGMTIRNATDMVLGAGTTDKLASELYDALRAKAEVRYGQDCGGDGRAPRCLEVR